MERIAGAFAYVLDLAHESCYNFLKSEYVQMRGMDMQPYRVWLFSDLLEKNKRVFKVPVYQRNYDWTNVQCEKIYQDIMLAHEHDHKHFTGTIVYIVGINGSNLSEVLIIDG